VAITKATKLVTSVYGVLVGLAGIEHGIFEILQGNIATGGLMINAIGPAYMFWPGASERAFTVMPSFLLAGIFAVIFSLLVTIWAGVFVQRRYGALILFLLAIILFLVGGGFAPIILTILASASATRINKPLTWWRTHLTGSARDFLGKIWPWILVAFVIVFWSTVAVQIFGSGFDVATTSILVSVLSVIMVALMPVAVVSGLAYDIKD
jgi:hypothetical protein